MNFRPWKSNNELKNSLQVYVKQGMKRVEMLDFITKDYPQYPWSLRTLARRLSFWDIKYSDVNISANKVVDAAKEELDGNGQLLGYWAMDLKIRQMHSLNVPRQLVHDVMYLLDKEGLEDRKPGGKKKARNGHYVTQGPNFMYSLDGHDKLMGFQNSTFPIAIYGCIDSASRKILWLKARVSNSHPDLVGR